MRERKKKNTTRFYSTSDQIYFGRYQNKQLVVARNFLNKKMKNKNTTRCYSTSNQIDLDRTL